MPTTRPPDIEAEIRFLTTEEGGRHTAVRSDYRPDHAMGHPEILNGARHIFLDRESVEPGGSARSQMIFTVPEYQYGRLFVGMEFTVQEGSKIVAKGRILRVLNADMKASQQ